MCATTLAYPYAELTFDDLHTEVRWGTKLIIEVVSPRGLVIRPQNRPVVSPGTLAKSHCRAKYW